MFKKVILFSLVLLLILPAAVIAERNEESEITPESEEKFIEKDKEAAGDTDLSVGGSKEKGEITVSGEGSVSAEPDIGYVNFSIVESGEEVIELYRKNIETADYVVEALVEYGLEKENIKTDSFNIRDDHTYLPPEQRKEQPSFVVTTDLRVLVKDLDEEMSEVIDVGVESGANRVSSIEFDVEAPQEHYYDAMEKALKDAEIKGERIASFYDSSLGEVKKVSEDTGRIGIGRGMEMDFGAKGVETIEEAGLDTTLPVEPDEINFESHVKVKYGLN